MDFDLGIGLFRIQSGLWERGRDARKSNLVKLLVLNSLMWH